MKEVEDKQLKPEKVDLRSKDTLKGTEGFEQIEFNQSDHHFTQIVKLKGGRQRIKFSIPERDLEEKFTKGFGPGG